MKYLFFLVLIPFIFSCKGLKRDEISQSTMSFDSTYIYLDIYFSKDCTESEKGFITIKQDSSFENATVVYSSGNPNERIRFEIAFDSALFALNTFEEKCKTKKPCGGYGGGTGVYIQKHFNGLITSFDYCQHRGDERWNGLEYFFNLMNQKVNNPPFYD